MNDYTKNRDFSVSITRKITDYEDNEIFMERHLYDTLGQALKALREFYKNDKVMYDKLKFNATKRECINDGYAYTMKIQYHGVRRKIIVGIDDISQYACEVFCLDEGSSVTQQEK